MRQHDEEQHRKRQAESLIGFLGRNVEFCPIIHPSFRSRTALVWKRSNRREKVRAFVAVATNLPARQ